MNLGYWSSGSDFVEWKVNFTASGEFQVSSLAASPFSGAILRLEADGTSLQVNVPNTGSHDNYRTIEFGVLRIKTLGIQTIRIRPADPRTWKPANLRAVKLRPLPAHTTDKT